MSINEELAVKCCSTLKKSIDKNDFSDWDVVGNTYWHQIKGLMMGNNIAISMQEEGRKKKYRVFVVSIQGTEVTSDFDAFSYKHTDKKLYIQFMNGDKAIITHSVKYGE